MSSPLIKSKAYEQAFEKLNDCQKKAFSYLCGSDRNVFLTGGAGTGKSYVLNLFREYIYKEEGDFIPVAASTGAAAILVRGQTFHRMFGLGVATDVKTLVERALEKSSVIGRMNHTDTLIVDEVSMLPGYVLDAAEEVARKARRREQPWGGMRIIAVGDFRQLPPVVKGTSVKPWAFLSEAWEKSMFKPLLLKTPVRSVDPHFVDILQDARTGRRTERIEKFIKDRLVDKNYESDRPRVYSKRGDVEHFNVKKLEELPGNHMVFTTEYDGPDHIVTLLKKDAPIPEVLILKPGALVMMRNNDEEDRWVNGSLGIVEGASLKGGAYEIRVSLKTGGLVAVYPYDFMYADEMGTILGTATNYPMSLAWATTIHKSQGATMDEALLDLEHLWEPGQLYVALSRVRNPDGIRILNWNPNRAFMRDTKVTEFHKKLLEETGGW